MQRIIPQKQQSAWSIEQTLEICKFNFSKENIPGVTKFLPDRMCVCEKGTDLFYIKMDATNTVYKISITVWVLHLAVRQQLIWFYLKIPVIIRSGVNHSLLRPDPNFSLPSTCGTELELTGPFSLFLSEPEAMESQPIFWVRDFTTLFSEHFQETETSVSDHVSFRSSLFLLFMWEPTLLANWFRKSAHTRCTSKKEYMR